MEKVQPIKDIEAISTMKAILRRKNYRDYLMFLLGCNTALRVGDLLNLAVGDVRTEEGDIRTHITVREEKTGKARRFMLRDNVRQELADYTIAMNDTTPLFPSRKGNKAITSVQAWRILNDAAKEAGIEEVGTHSMRKSFAYHAYQKTHDVAVVQRVLNHSSPSITKRYLGIEDDEVEKALEGFEL